MPAALPLPAGDAALAPGPEGGLYVLVSVSRESVTDPSSRSVLALLDETGRPRAGWPIEITGSDCDWIDSTWTPQVAADGSVRLVCIPDEEPGLGSATVRAYAFDPDGTLKTGWPVDISVDSREQPRVIGDRLYILAVEYSPLDLSEDVPQSAAFWIVTVDADGTPRTGARYAVPDAGWVGLGARLGPDGTAYLPSWPDTAARRVTEIQAFDVDGARSGWPVHVDGLTVGPAFGAAGRIFLTTPSPDGRTSRTYVFDRDGRLAAFASAALPVVPTAAWTGAGPDRMPAPPIVAEDGAVFILGESGGKATVLALDPTGKAMAGWPYRANMGVQWRGSCAPEDIGCGVWRTTPAVGPGDVLHLLLSARIKTVGGSIVAVGPDGRLRPGWPIELARAGAEFRSVVVGQDGTAYAVAVEPEVRGTSATILAIAPDGGVRYRTTVVEP